MFLRSFMRITQNIVYPAGPTLVKRFLDEVFQVNIICNKAKKWRMECPVGAPFIEVFCRPFRYHVLLYPPF
jgi:hypothetical protein